MIDIRNLSKSFGARVVLRGVDLRVGSGERVVIIGPSGSGKSTLLRCVNLLEVPDIGEIFLGGVRIFGAENGGADSSVGVCGGETHKAESGGGDSNALESCGATRGGESCGVESRGGETHSATCGGESHGVDSNTAESNTQNQTPKNRTKAAALQKVGMVFQHFNLFANLSVLDNLTLAPTRLNILSKEAALKKAHALLKRIGLDDKSCAYPSHLSGGQKQRVAIVRALMTSPKVMLFDEPTSALDVEMVGEVLELIKSLDSALTMMIVTHELNFARDIADKIIFMEDGQITEEAPTAEFFNSPKTPRAREFLSKVR